MRILVVGATGTIGRAIVALLQADHEIVPVSHRRTAVTVDIADPASIEAMYRAVGTVDAVLCAAGQVKFGPLTQLTDADLQLSLSSKLMGQVNLVRRGLDHVHDNGSFTLTSGVLPMHSSAAIGLVNGGIEGFARAAAREAPRGIRVNVVSPPWVAETLQALGMDPAQGLPAATIAGLYAQSIVGNQNGAVIAASAGLG